MQEAVKIIESLIDYPQLKNYVVTDDHKDLTDAHENAKDKFEADFEYHNDDNEWIPEEDYGDDGILWKLAKQEFLDIVLKEFNKNN